MTPAGMTFDLYPSIDLRGGRVVRLHQGDFDRETVYGDDPIAVARSFEAAGARWIHVVDLDAARRDGSNRDLVVAIASSVSVPVQSGGGVRDGSLLDEGVARVVVGSVAIEEPEVVRSMAERWPERVAVGLDHRDGEVHYRGWEQGSGRQLLDVASELAIPGVAAFLVTEISRDATMAGPDTEGLGKLLASTSVPVIASGGVGSLDDLVALRSSGVAGVIVGKAIYEGRFKVEEAVLACAP
jgi:phosphoribosylformimino-5-aminoimidazole carboxamide ribotide isomerase